jgi:hypothetical protein
VPSSVLEYDSFRSVHLPKPVQPRKWQVQTTLNKLVPLQVGSAPWSAGDTFELRGYPKADRTNLRWETAEGPMLAA